MKPPYICISSTRFGAVLKPVSITNVAGPSCVVILSTRCPLAIAIRKFWKDKGLLLIRPGNHRAHLWSQREKSEHLWSQHTCEVRSTPVTEREGTNEPGFCFYWGGTDSCNFNKYFGIIFDYGKSCKDSTEQEFKSWKRKTNKQIVHMAVIEVNQDF